MSRRIDLLRLDYAFAVILPCLISIYMNQLKFFDYIDMMGGFLLLAVFGNLLNDSIDAKDPKDVDTQERLKGYRPKEIFSMALLAFCFGIFLFVRTCVEHFENLILLIVAGLMVVGYCVKFKNWVVINQILLAVSHVLIPYFMIKIDYGIYTTTVAEWLLLFTFFAYAVTGQIVHESIDGDAITRFSLRTQQIIVWISSIITIVLGLLTCVFFWIYPHPVVAWYVFLPVTCIPIGTMYIFRVPKQSPKGVKDVGLVCGNFVLIYMIVLIFQNKLF